MTPSRVSATVVADRLAWIDTMLAGVRALPLDTLAVFESDPRNAAAAESYLRRALEALLDLGRHLLAKGFAVVATEYRDIPKQLESHGVIGADQARVLARMAGYRNRMVHFYIEVSREELYEICTQRLVDIESAANQMRAWLRANPDRLDRSL